MVPEVSSTCHQGTVPKPPPYPSPEVRGQGVLLSQQDACLTHNSVLGMAGTVGCGWLSGGGVGVGGQRGLAQTSRWGRGRGPENSLTDASRVRDSRGRPSALAPVGGRGDDPAGGR